MKGWHKKSFMVLGAALAGAAATLAAWKTGLGMPTFGAGEPEPEALGAEESVREESVARAVSPTRLRADVEALSGPRNRLHSPEAMVRTEEMIEDSFRQTGLVVERRPFVFYDVTGYTDHEPFEATTYPLLEGANIVATKPGEESSDALVFLAHYDTVRDSPGANDNTASVAALLELARILADHRFQHTVIFAATDMEELGFLGSRALVAELAGERRVLAAINFETMAYTSSEPDSQAVPPGLGLLYREQVRRIRRRQSKGDFTTVIYNGAATPLASRFAAGISRLAGRDSYVSLRDPNDLPLIGKLLNKTVPAVREFSRSDHVPFWEAVVPAIQVTDTANFRYPHYHQPTDTPEKLDYEHLAAIVGASSSLAAAGFSPGSQRAASWKRCVH